MEYFGFQFRLQIDKNNPELRKDLCGLFLKQTNGGTNFYEGSLEIGFGVMQITIWKIDEDKCVSSDFIGCDASSIFVPDTTQVVSENMVKVLAWYDNEWGYASRLVDMAAFVGK